MFCQQLAHLTNGVYTEVVLDSLLPRLLVCFPLLYPVPGEWRGEAPRRFGSGVSVF